MSSRNCIYWELKEGYILEPWQDAPRKNCGTCQYYLPDGCKIYDALEQQAPGITPGALTEGITSTRD